MMQLYTPVFTRIPGWRTLYVALLLGIIPAAAYAQPEPLDPGHGPLFGPVRTVSIVKPGVAPGGRDSLIERRYEFSPEGRLTAIVEPEIRKGLASRITYSYDADGKLLEVLSQYEGKGKGRERGYRWRYRYEEGEDEAGRLMKRMVTSVPGDSLIMRVLYRTDSLGRRSVMAAEDGADGLPVIRSTIYYGRRGGSAEHRMLFEKGKMTHDMDIRKDPDGSMKHITDIYLTERGDTSAIEMRTYDEHGWERQIEKRILSQPEVLEVTSYSYPVIGDRGNWLKRVWVRSRTKAGTPEEKVEGEEERVITYY